MIVVTGATGFTGGYVGRLLANEGVPFRILARDPRRAEHLASLGAEVVRGCFEDYPSLVGAFRGCDLLLNIASLGFGHAPAIVAAAREAGIKRAVFVSTTAIFTTLDTRTKATRLEAEKLIQESGLDWTIIRPTMIYGSEHDRNIYRMLRLLRRTPVFPVPGNGRQLQQPVHVTDVARAVVDAANSPATFGRSYNIAGRVPLTFNELIDTAAAAMGQRIMKVHVPVGLILPPLRLYEHLSHRPLLKAEQVMRLGEDKAFSYENATQDFNFRPLSFSEGVERMVQELRDKGLL